MTNMCENSRARAQAPLYLNPSDWHTPNTYTHSPTTTRNRCENTNSMARSKLGDKAPPSLWRRWLRRITEVAQQQLRSAEESHYPIFATAHGVYERWKYVAGFRGCRCTPPCRPGAEADGCESCRPANRKTAVETKALDRASGAAQQGMRTAIHRQPARAALQRPEPPAPAAPDPGPAPAVTTAEPAAAAQQGAPPHMPLAAPGGAVGGDAPDAVVIEAADIVELEAMEAETEDGTAAVHATVTVYAGVVEGMIVG